MNQLEMILTKISCLIHAISMITLTTAVQAHQEDVEGRRPEGTTIYLQGESHLLVE